MSNSDISSQYQLRYNVIDKTFEFGSGLNWTPISIIAGVDSVNTLTGAITLAAGSNITLTPSGNTITVAAMGGDGTSAGPNNAIQTSDGSGGFKGSTDFLWDPSGAAALTLKGAEPSFLIWSDNPSAIQEYSANGATQFSGILQGPSAMNIYQRYSGLLCLDTTGDNSQGGVAKQIQLRTNNAAGEGTPITVLAMDASKIVVVSDSESGAASPTNITVDNSAVLEARSTTRGLLIPRLTTTQRNSVSSPTDGLLVYDSTLHELFQRQNGNWVAIGSGGAGSVTPSVQFVASSSFSTNSGSFVATGTKITGFSLSNSTHKVKISVAGQFRNDSTTSGDLYATIFRDGTTNLGNATTGMNNLGLGSSAESTLCVPGALVYLDAVGDTSAHTYEVYIRGDDSALRWFPVQTGGATMIVEEVI